MRPVLSRARHLTWVAVLLVACTAPGAVGSPTPVPTEIATPTLTPTATPLPPVLLTVRWPAHVSPLRDLVLEVDAPGLQQRDPEARLWARVFDPVYRLWWMGDLYPLDDDTFAARRAIHLPLDLPSGEWTLRVSVLSTAPVTGELTLHFVPEPVALRDLRTEVRKGISLPVPRAFVTVHAEGDEIAGARIWQGVGEVGLWWTPGPAEPLTEDTARVLLDATHPDDVDVGLVAAESVSWYGTEGFRFSERWPQGPAETLVLQGSDRWLYALRIRSLDGPVIPPLLWDIQAGFRIGGAEE